MIVTVQGYLSPFIKVVLSSSSSSSNSSSSLNMRCILCNMHLVTGEIYSKCQEAALRSLDGTAIGIEHP